MPLTFDILPALNLVFVAYDGIMSIEETAEKLGAYARHPDFHPSQRHLLDLTRVTGWEKDFPRLMAMQASQVDVFAPAEHPPLVVYHAPTQIADDAARAVLNWWDKSSVVLPRLSRTEPEALDILGIDASAFTDLSAFSGRAP